jgi:hypothetical protein
MFTQAASPETSFLNDSLASKLSGVFLHLPQNGGISIVHP